MKRIHGDEGMRRKINVDKQIIKALKDEPLTWSQLAKRADVSKGALSKHLNDLIRKGIVLTEVTESRPPITLYRLADERFVNLTLHMTTIMDKEQSDYFLTEILSPRVREVLFDAYFEMMKQIPFPPIKISLKDLLPQEEIKEEEIKTLIEEMKISDEKSFRLSLQDFINVNFEETPSLVVKEFSYFTVQSILTIYFVEKKMLDLFPKNLRDMIMQRGRLNQFFISRLVQERGVWREFERFAEWWYREVTPKIPSCGLLTILTLHSWLAKLQSTYLPSIMKK